MSNFYVLAPLPEVTVLKPVPNSILSNCYAYARSRYPGLPGTNHILANLSTSGEIAIFYYPDSGLHHYAVVESVSGTSINISETNYGGHFVNYRTVPRSDPHFLGFYDL